MSARVEFTEGEWGPGTVEVVRKGLGKTEAEIAKEAGITEEKYKRYARGEIIDLLVDVKINQALKRLGGKHPKTK
jgi:predicted transcriptional regulator